MEQQPQQQQQKQKQSTGDENSNKKEEEPKDDFTLIFDTPNISKTISPANNSDGKQLNTNMTDGEKKGEEEDTNDLTTSIGLVNITSNRSENECSILFCKIKDDENIRKQFIEAQWDDHELIGLNHWNDVRTKRDDSTAATQLLKDHEKYNTMKFVEEIFTCKKAWLECEQIPILLHTNIIKNEMFVKDEVKKGGGGGKRRVKGKSKKKEKSSSSSDMCHIRILAHSPDVIICGVMLETNAVKRKIQNFRLNVGNIKETYKKKCDEVIELNNSNILELKSMGKRRIPYEIEDIKQSIAMIKVQKENFLKTASINIKIDEKNPHKKQIEERVKQEAVILSLIEKREKEFEKKILFFENALKLQQEKDKEEKEEDTATVTKEEEKEEEEKNDKVINKESHVITIDDIHDNNRNNGAKLFDEPQFIKALHLTTTNPLLKISSSLPTVTNVFSNVREPQINVNNTLKQQQKTLENRLFTLPELITCIQYPSTLSSSKNNDNSNGEVNDTFFDYYTETAERDTLDRNYFGLSKKDGDTLYYNTWRKFNLVINDDIDKSGNSKWFKGHLLIHIDNEKNETEEKYWEHAVKFPFMIYYDCVTCVCDNYWNPLYALKPKEHFDNNGDKIIFFCQQGLLSVWTLNEIMKSENPYPHILLQGIPQIEKICVSNGWCVLLTKRKTLLCIKLHTRADNLERYMTREEEEIYWQQPIIGKEPTLTFYPGYDSGDTIYYISVPLCSTIEFKTTPNGRTSLLYIGSVNGYVHEIDLDHIIPDPNNSIDGNLQKSLISWTRSLITYNYTDPIKTMEIRNNRVLTTSNKGLCLITIPSPPRNTIPENNDKERIARKNNKNPVITMCLGRCISARFCGNIIFAHKHDQTIFIIDTLEGKVGAIHKSEDIFKDRTDPIYLESTSSCGLPNNIFKQYYRYQSIQLVKNSKYNGKGREYRILLTDGRIIQCVAENVIIKK